MRTGYLFLRKTILNIQLCLMKMFVYTFQPLFRLDQRFSNFLFSCTTHATQSRTYLCQPSKKKSTYIQNPICMLGTYQTINKTTLITKNMLHILSCVLIFAFSAYYPKKLDVPPMVRVPQFENR